MFVASWLQHTSLWSFDILICFYLYKLSCCTVLYLLRVAVLVRIIMNGMLQPQGVCSRAFGVVRCIRSLLDCLCYQNSVIGSAQVTIDVMLGSKNQGPAKHWLWRVIGLPHTRQYQTSILRRITNDCCHFVPYPHSEICRWNWIILPGSAPRRVSLNILGTKMRRMKLHCHSYPLVI